MEEGNATASDLLPLITYRHQLKVAAGQVDCMLYCHAEGTMLYLNHII